MATGAEAPPVEVQGPVGDPFGAPDFQVTAYVNRLFPNEASLTQLDPLIGTLKQKISRVDAEILAAVRQQSTSGSRARQDLSSAKATIEELFGRIRDIQRKAEQSELMVQEICRDIKKLDYAKKHLTATITAMRRLAMLVNAVDQLQLAVERHEYAEAAHLLEAVQQLSSHFQSYAHIPKVAEIKGRLGTLERSLHINVLREFELLGEEAPSPLLLERLKSCCLVVEALGYQVRDELIDAVCKREMGVYTQIFSTMGETAKLERTVNRYKWLLKRLEARKDVWSIFPAHWHVPQLLCIMFCNITKTQLAEILDTRTSELPSQVDNLLKAVEATNIFETEMARRFEGAVEPRDPSDDQVRERYERLLRERQRAEEGGVSAQRVKEQEHAASAAVARTNFKGSISGVFAPYLHCYLDEVEQELLRGLDQMMKQETWQPFTAELKVLKSSNELVEAIKSELKDCVLRVSRGRTLLELGGVFQRVYRAYAARLVTRLPKTASGATSGTAVLGTADWQVKMTDDDINVICLIMSTAEHCQEMVQQLAKTLAARLDPPLGEKVDMSEEEDELQSVITQCLTVLLLGIETKLEGALAAMARMNWGGMEMAGDQSEYVGAVRKVLMDSSSRLGPNMPANYFRFFCDKLLRSFAPRFLDNVLRCKKISDVGCQQMRLDTEVIKGLLVDLAKEGQLDAAALQAFSSDVHSQLGRAEGVLKVVGSPPEAMVHTFFELMPNGSPSDFQRIVDLKVLKRGEHQQILEQFNRRMGRPMPSNQPSAGAAAAVGQQQQQRPAGFSLPGRSQGPSAGAGKGSSNTASELASRLRMNANVAKASAAAAGDSMRETMGRTIGAMKSLRFMQRE